MRKSWGWGCLQTRQLEALAVTASTSFRALRQQRQVRWLADLVCFQHSLVAIQVTQVARNLDFWLFVPALGVTGIEVDWFFWTAPIVNL